MVVWIVPFIPIVVIVGGSIVNHSWHRSGCRMAYLSTLGV